MHLNIRFIVRIEMNILFNLIIVGIIGKSFCLKSAIILLGVSQFSTNAFKL